MKNFRKILLSLCLLWVLICLITLTMGDTLPFEFINKTVARSFYFVIWLSFPIALLIIPIKTKKVKTNWLIAIKLLLALVAFVFGALCIFRGNMCGYITDGVFCVNKFDSSVKIIRRNYDCGIFDTNVSSELKYFKVKPITAKIIYVTAIDTALINSEEWIKPTTTDNK